ncbi:MAG: ribonuclease III [Lachnospiraceae bacterium]|nr:ribonuclease III [Lachnospiraceae bacterium]
MNSKEEAVLTLQEGIGYSFKDKNLLIEALSHTSYTNERKLNKLHSYQRLEFLGDAVLELCTSRYLFDRYPGHNEGELTKERASMVCEEALAKCAEKLELGKYILLGVGETQSHGEKKPSILCDVFEAIIGAIYVDGGFETACKFIEVHVFRLGVTASKDSKTVLQEIVQAWEHVGNIVYESVEESGPEHQRIFRVRVLINGTEYGTGNGSSKKEAEMHAAEVAVKRLNGR